MYTTIPQVSELPLPSCPRCGKQTLVKCTNEDVYCCLNCSFRRDLSRYDWNSSGLFGAIALISVGVIFFAVTTAGESVKQLRNTQPLEIKPQKNIQIENSRPVPLRTVKPTS